MTFCITISREPRLSKVVEERLFCSLVLSFHVPELGCSPQHHFKGISDTLSARLPVQLADKTHSTGILAAMTPKSINQARLARCRLHASIILVHHAAYVLEALPFSKAKAVEAAKVHVLWYMLAGWGPQPTLSLAGLNRPAALGTALCAASTVRRPPRPGLATFHLSSLLLVVRTVRFPGKALPRENCWRALLNGVARARLHAGCCLCIGLQHTARAVVEKAILANSRSLKRVLGHPTTSAAYCA